MVAPLTIARGSLNGKTALLTGAAQGIGLAIATRLAEAGANLVLIDLAEAQLESAAAQLREKGARVLAKTMDVADRPSAQALHAEASQAFGAVDILINNAAIGPERNHPAYLVAKPKFWTTQDDLWLDMMRVNIFGAQLLGSIFAPDMVRRGWGRIINVSTSLDTMYRQGIGPYGPCKAALEALSRIMFQDLEGTGVTVNVLLPGGPVNSRMVPADCGIAAEQLIQPDELAEPVLWLCSREADATSGLRFVARQWDERTSVDERLAKASAPIAWPQLGAQSHIPIGIT
ncbi:SDR family NAD(P)-dependent oxidoreductase [Variovorax sp. ZT4R33]|uniref:SDR family NAD(P)-dependent oxidoreductase n=1 Tax=Variovorax sp. ZT4R33 TaxID=3443743 RepID=UPI003F46332F